MTSFFPMGSEKTCQAGGKKIKPNGFGFYSKKLCLIFATLLSGKWRSPVAHLYGVQGVASSNLVFPTNKKTSGESQGFFHWTLPDGLRSDFKFPCFMFSVLTPGIQEAVKRFRWI
jgi:hypothetical protein